MLKIVVDFTLINPIMKWFVKRCCFCSFWGHLLRFCFAIFHFWGGSPRARGARGPARARGPAGCLDWWETFLEYPVRNYFNCNSLQPLLKISGFRNAFQTFREHSAYQLEYFREDGAERTLHLPDLAEVNPKVQKLMEVEGLEDLLKAT